MLLAGANAPSARATPANDDFPGEALGSLPATVSGDSTGATLEVDEPVPDCDTALTQTIWWNVTPVETTWVELTVETDGSWSPVFAVWGPSSFPGGGLSQETCGGYPAFPGEPPIPTAFGAFEALAGETYYVQVGGDDFFGFGGPAGGTVTLTLVAVAPPENDNIADAIQVGTLPFSHEFSITGATSEPDEPQTPCLEGLAEFGVSFGKTAWYRLTVEEASLISVDVEAEGAALMVAWTGNPGALSHFDCVSGVLGFAAEAGETYYIQLGMLIYDDFPVEAQGGPVEVVFDTLTIPSCPGGPGQLFTDPLGDVFIPPGTVIPQSVTFPELESVLVVEGLETTCLTFTLAGPLPTEPEEALGIFAALDLDSDVATGFPTSPEWECTTQEFPLDTVGADTQVGLPFPSKNLLTELYSYDFSGDEVTAVITTKVDSVTVAIPTSFLGRDGGFNFMASLYGEYSVDCVPNTGKLSVGQVVAPRFGDLDCNGGFGPGDIIPILADEAETPPPPNSCTPVGEPMPLSYPSGGTGLISGDLNCDGEVNLDDALYALSFLASAGVELVADCPSPLASPLE